MSPTEHLQHEVLRVWLAHEYCNDRSGLPRDVGHTLESMLQGPASGSSFTCHKWSAIQIRFKFKALLSKCYTLSY